MLNFDSFVNEAHTVDDYLSDALSADEWVPAPPSLYSMLEEEGWIDDIEDEYGKDVDKSMFKYKELDISDSDRDGLITLRDETLEKFNDFDIKLKDGQSYPYYILDFVDYSDGIVYIVKFDVEA